MTKKRKPEPPPNEARDYRPETNGFEINGYDLTEMHRRLDDAQLKGLDFLMLDRWRQLLDAYEHHAFALEKIESEASNVRLRFEDLEVDWDELGVDVTGPLCDLVSDGKLTQEISDHITDLIGAAVTAERKRLKDLHDEAQGRLTKALDNLDEVLSLATA